MTNKLALDKRGRLGLILEVKAKTNKYKKPYISYEGICLEEPFKGKKWQSNSPMILGDFVGTVKD